MTPRDQPIETPYRQRVADFKQRRLPVLVWSIAALISLTLLVGRAQQYEYVGLAQALQYEVSSSTNGQIESLLVDVYDDVDVGQPVVRLNDSQVLASIHTTEAGIRKLQADLDAEQARLVSTSGQDRANWSGELRRFQMDEQQRRLAGLELRVTIESDEIELQRLALDLSRKAPLLERGVIGQQEYDETRLRHDGVRNRLEKNRALSEQTESEYRAARDRRDAFEKGHPRVPAEQRLLQPLREAVAVESRRLEEIRLQRETLVLRSPVAGQVSQIYHRTGRNVVPGEAILSISERSAREIVAWLPEPDGARISRRAPALVSSAFRPEKVAESTVLRVGPTVETLPPRMWRDPSVPDYGRAVVIAGAPALNLTPGEVVNVRFPSRH